jgi:hypothetical protein
VGIAEAYLQKSNSLAGVPPAVAVTRAEYAIAQSLKLDDSLPEGHLAAAELRMIRHDWAGAGREYRRAIDLRQNARFARWLRMASQAKTLASREGCPPYLRLS